MRAACTHPNPLSLQCRAWDALKLGSVAKTARSCPSPPGLSQRRVFTPILSTAAADAHSSHLHRIYRLGVDLAPRRRMLRYATSALARAASSSWASASAQRGAALQALSRPLASGTAASAGTSSGGDGNSSSRWGFASGALALTGAAAAVGHSSLADTPSAPSTAPRWSGLSGDVTLYQYEVCPFCCKAKAALDYYGVPYKVVEVNPVTKRQLKSLGSEYRKVPVLVGDGEVINESNVIMDRVVEAAREQGVQGGKAERKAGEGGSWFGRGQGRKERPPSAEERARALEWRKWSDEKFVRVITVNIYRTWAESLQTFDYISRECHWGAWEAWTVQYVGAVMMYFIAKRMIGKYQLDADVRGQLFRLSDEWVAGLEGKPFMGGDRPNIADLSVFGVLQAVRGTDTFVELMEGEEVKAWYMRMVGVMPRSKAKRVDT